MSAIIDDFGQLIEQFVRMRGMYGTTAPMIARPFSGWRPTNRTCEGLGTDVIDAETWARSLEFHTAHIGSAYLKRKLHLPNCCTGHLFKLISSWLVNRDEITGDQFLRLLQEHYRELLDMRREYVAAMAGAELAKLAIP